MTWWEYKHIRYFDLGKGVDIDELNELGRDGWEVVAIYRIEPLPYISLGSFNVVLKRQAVSQ